MINLNNYYKLKYLKYKNKYISLQNQYGGAPQPPNPAPAKLPPPPSPPPPALDSASAKQEQPSLLSDIGKVKLRKADPTKISKAPQRICVPNRDGGFKTFNLCITANPPK